MNTRWFAMFGFVAALFLFVPVMQKDTTVAQAPAKQRGFCYAKYKQMISSGIMQGGGHHATTDTTP